MSDFINRINPKDINKLQLEGLVQAGTFDNLINNRKSLFSSIPNIILKSKNIHENKTLNQIDLFGEQDNEEMNFINDINDWSTDIKLSKEFETLGFYISDHPINQYKIIFKNYKIKSFEYFENNKKIINSNIACTVLKIQEKKTQKGNTYAIIKFSDLSNVFELFIFSDVFELNRDILVEGKSVLLTLNKIFNDESKTNKRINVVKVVSLDDLLNKTIKDITFSFNSFNEAEKLKKIEILGGETTVKIYIQQNNEIFRFNLKNKKKNK